MHIVDFNPDDGQAFQGDVAIIPIPSGITISRLQEIAPKDGKLILQEGELTGHHHHIDLRQRHFKPAREIGDPVLTVRSNRLRRAFGGKRKSEETAPSARLYRDPTVAAEMQTRKLLTRADLAVGCLVVEGGPMTVTHQEHDGIRLPVGNYLIGRQVESAGAEERVVAD